VHIVFIPFINVKIIAFWDVTPSHLHTDTNILEEDDASIFRANVSSTWRMEQKIPPRCCYISIKLCGIMSQRH